MIQEVEISKSTVLEIDSESRTATIIFLEKESYIEVKYTFTQTKQYEYRGDYDLEYYNLEVTDLETEEDADPIVKRYLSLYDTQLKEHINTHIND